jgi:uncharacterized protein (DUF885 family)
MPARRLRPLLTATLALSLPLLPPTAAARPADPPAFDHGAAAGVRSAPLAALLADHWSWLMRRSPTWATRLGDHQYDDRLEDLSPAALAADRAAREAFLQRAERIAAAGLHPDDQLTLSLFQHELRAGLATDLCHTEQWGLSARNNPLVSLGWLAEGVSLDTAAARAAYLSRLEAFPTLIAQDGGHLRAGVAAGRTPERAAVEVVLAQLDAALAKPAAEWAVAAPLAAVGEGALAARVIDGRLRPALMGYRELLRGTVLPAARPAEKAGVWALPEGAACYAALSARETSLALSPDEIHAIGLRALAEIHAELAVLGARALGTDDLQAILVRLRTDPKLRFQTEEEVEAAAAEALAAAQAAVPRAFGRLPAAECGVRRVPAHEAPYTTIAYYWPAVPGEAPGFYVVNTSAPETRPRFEARALAFHESVPGHHLQIALAQELPALPAFRRHLGTTAFVEGWALYSERLADELGLYRDDLDRIGMLSFDTWRAARLVVDTGVHAKGWTREQAVRFMLENTPLAENNIRNEVDRYITWPGQALSYKLGQLELRALRTEAEAALGPRFALADFHDVVLGAGAVPLPVLRQRVQAWVARGGGAARAAGDGPRAAASSASGAPGGLRDGEPRAHSAGHDQRQP